MDIIFTKTFKEAFGYTPPQKVVIPQAPARKESGLGSSYYATDALGREFFMPVTLNGILIPFAVVSIICKKTIISTAMPERGGSVKEQVSLDDYVINIKGILINNSNDFPESDIINIHKNVFLPNESISLRSVLTDIYLNGEFNHKVIIKEIKWPGAAAVEHVRAFEIDCESDMIFTLEIA